MVPMDRKCIVGSMVSIMFLTALTMLPRSLSERLAVLSARTTTSIGFGVSAPHDPLQAADATEPVDPLGSPNAKLAKPNGTSFWATTSTVLQFVVGLGAHGILQMTPLHRRSGYFDVVYGP